MDSVSIGPYAPLVATWVLEIGRIETAKENLIESRATGRNISLANAVTRARSDFNLCALVLRFIYRSRLYAPLRSRNVRRKQQPRVGCPDRAQQMEQNGGGRAGRSGRPQWHQRSLGSPAVLSLTVTGISATTAIAITLHTPSRVQYRKAVACSRWDLQVMAGTAAQPDWTCEDGRAAVAACTCPSLQVSCNDE